jgi:hypothetical protein
MVERDLPFKPSTARRLTKIAANECLSNRAHAHVLPQSWMTLYELTKLPAPELVARIEDGVINPKMQRKDVMALLGGEPRPRAERLKRCQGANTFSCAARSDELQRRKGPRRLFPAERRRV